MKCALDRSRYRFVVFTCIRRISCVSAALQFSDAAICNGPPFGRLIGLAPATGLPVASFWLSLSGDYAPWEIMAAAETALRRPM